MARLYERDWNRAGRPEDWRGITRDRSLRSGVVEEGKSQPGMYLVVMRRKKELLLLDDAFSFTMWQVIINLQI